MADGSPGGPQYPPLPHIPQSGWERVREMYQRNERGEYSQEVEFMVKSAITGMVVGLVYGGVPAAFFSRAQYIKQSQAELYRHRFEAVRSSHDASTRGFIRYGLRWGWRVTAFVTIFNAVNSGLSAYRDKVVMSHFAAAGAAAGGLFRINLGLRGVIGGSFIGALLGVPVGAMVSGLQALAGEDFLEHKRRGRHQFRDEKLQEWSDQLQLTDDILRGMEKAETESAESQLEKITELLQQPRNADLTPEE